MLCYFAAEGNSTCCLDGTEFAARLRVLRKAWRMSREEIAEVLNISLEHLSRMERGKRKRSIDWIAAHGLLLSCKNGLPVHGKLL